MGARTKVILSIIGLFAAATAFPDFFGAKEGGMSNFGWMLCGISIGCFLWHCLDKK